MARPERFIDVGVETLHELLGKDRIIALFSGIEAEVLQKCHTSDQRLEVLANWGDRELWIGLTFGPSKMRTGRNTCTTSHQLFKKRKGSADTKVIRDPCCATARFYWAVEIDSD